MHQTRHLALLVGLALATQFPLAGCGQNWTPAEHVSKAREFVDKGDLQSASIELANALQKDPNTVEARWLMANVALQLGDAPRAERDARKAIELGLSRTTGQLTLVKALLFQHEAEKVLTETSLIPDDTPPAEKRHCSVFAARHRS
jgi:cytochrome c-type biogenesis protein CcmH/NrfG